MLNSTTHDIDAWMTIELNYEKANKEYRVKIKNSNNTIIKNNQ
jgi:hypothetical protein